MRRDLLIAAGPGEWRVVWAEDGIPAELHVERGDIHPAGSIHLGRVVRLAAGLDAALVDIGEERPAFLPVRGAPPHEGARIVVQVRRETQRGKGALLSARIESVEADRLAAGAATLDPPAQLYPAPGFANSLKLRLPGCPERVLVEEAAPLGELRQSFPAAEITQSPIGDWPLDLDALFDCALAATVPLPGGGTIHIDEARAAVLIDVDTGSRDTGSAERSSRRANLAAARMIARQLRLRQLGGGIVVDFAALDAPRERERLRQAMAAALAGDPAKPQLLGWTRLGHLELVRPRRLPLAVRGYARSAGSAQKRGDTGFRGVAPALGRSPRKPGTELALGCRSGCRGGAARTGGRGACCPGNASRTPDRHHAVSGWRARSRRSQHAAF